MERARQPLVVALVILATAALLTLPAALGPVRYNDSFWIDWVWLDQFARELGNGVLYPRWLPLSHDGLGSPVFYYYAPLSFYAGSIFVLAGLDVYSAVLATFVAGYVLSGLGTYLWLKDQSRLPLLGVLVYMAAPYHAFDFYLRGAAAEFFAAALLPFVMYGLRSISQGRPGGIAVTSLSYAAVIASHLPLALLASLFLFGPYSLILVRERRSDAPLLAAAFAIGIAIASIYLVPALLLEPYRDAAKLWDDAFLQPQNWTFWNRGSLPPGYPGALLTGCAMGLSLAGLFLWRRSGWALYGLICVALAVGVVPALWSLPLLQSVQFPFRLLPLAEFALATCMALAPFRGLAIALAAAPLLAATAFISEVPPQEPSLPPAQLHAVRPDVPENLPPGERPYSWPSHWALGIAATHRQAQFSNGVTVEPVFYFPSWEVRCGNVPVDAFPAPGTQLLAYKGQNCSRRLSWTSAERIGAFISLLGMLVLVAVARGNRLGRKPLLQQSRGGSEGPPL